jgi:hypothetical protein
MRSVKAGGLCVNEPRALIFNMLAIRIYISALTLIFLVLVIAHRGLGLLEGVIITCAVVYLILDVRTELQSLKLEFRLLQELEQHISKLRRQIP